MLTVSGHFFNQNNPVIDEYFNILENVCEQSTQVEADDTFHRYERQHLLRIMELKVSTSEPNLSDNVRRSSDSKTFLTDILEVPLTFSRSDENFIRKSFSSFTLSGGKYSEIDTSSISPPSSFLRKSHSLISSIDSPEVSVLCKFRSNLNKLSDDNFNAILEEMRNLQVNDDETILKLIEILYAKAIKEPMFASHYVKLTMALKHDFVVKKNYKSFENLAIAAIETGHEQATSKLAKISELDQDHRDTLRRDLVGSMKFIAEMHENEVLSCDFIVKICEELLDFECEESIEPLCKLLEFVSSKIIFDERIKSIFRRINEIAHRFSTRIRFMIETLLGKHRDCWEVKRPLNSQTERDKTERKSTRHHKSSWGNRNRKFRKD